jgi:hypothetical protein
VVTAWLGDSEAPRLYGKIDERMPAQLADFRNAYNVAELPRALTPYEATCKLSTDRPDRFRADPIQDMPGPSRYTASFSLP